MLVHKPPMQSVTGTAYSILLEQSLLIAPLRTSVSALCRHSNRRSCKQKPGNSSLCCSQAPPPPPYFPDSYSSDSDDPVLLSLNQRPERMLAITEELDKDEDGQQPIDLIEAYLKDSSLQSLDVNPNHRSGYVAVIGKPNVGKSTLTNMMIGQKLSIVTNKPQTTRHRILGLCSEPDYQEGKALKHLATAARLDIQTFMQKEVYLEVKVKVRPNWRRDELFLKQSGYSGDIRA